tara:strand:- start:672 stop:1169 length:498 start_codon:yes stop_codon:yes gene_type:complete
MKNKRGQMKISFGMIVSIILIIIFISFAFYATQKFLGISKSVQIGKFAEDLQNDVDKIWKSSQGSDENQYSLPSKIELVCFIDYGSDAIENQNIYDELEIESYGTKNLFFYPLEASEGTGSKTIKNINLQEITQTKNPFCIENINGEISITVKKDFNEVLVTITN